MSKSISLRSPGWGGMTIPPATGRRCARRRPVLTTNAINLELCAGPAEEREAFLEEVSQQRRAKKIVGRTRTPWPSFRAPQRRLQGGGQAAQVPLVSITSCTARRSSRDAAQRRASTSREHEASRRRHPSPVRPELARR